MTVYRNLAAAALAGAVLFLAGCGSGSTPRPAATVTVTATPSAASATASPAVPAVAPPGPASAILEDNGYTLAENMTPGQITCYMGWAAPYVTSAAIGVDPAGGAEAVVTFTPAGMAILDSRAGGDLSSYAESRLPGDTVAVNGDILTIDFPVLPAQSADPPPACIGDVAG